MGGGGWRGSPPGTTLASGARGIAVRLRLIGRTVGAVGQPYNGRHVAPGQTKTDRRPVGLSLAPRLVGAAIWDHPSPTSQPRADHRRGEGVLCVVSSLLRRTGACQEILSLFREGVLRLEPVRNSTHYPRNPKHKRPTSIHRRQHLRPRGACAMPRFHDCS